jgi:hypothetical protein
MTAKSVHLKRWKKKKTKDEEGGRVPQPRIRAHVCDFEGRFVGIAEMTRLDFYFPVMN